MINYKVQDTGDSRRYFTMIPNMIDDLDLSLIAFRLYCHLKRVTGESGVCYQSGGTLARACQMSTGAISKAKTELVSKGLIRVKVQKDNTHSWHEIILLDIWGQNMEMYRSRPSPQEKAPSPGETPPSPGETKNNPLKNNGSTPYHKNDREASPLVEESQPMIFEQEAIPEQPAPQPEKKSSRDERTNLAPIQAFRRVVGKYPRKAVYDLVIAKVGGKPDDKLIRLAWEAWNARGFNPEGIGWLDWVAAGEIPKNGKRPAPEPVYQEQY